MSDDTRELRPRVKAALEYLDYCRRVTQSSTGGDCAQDNSRDLLAVEIATRDASLDMLTKYFLGEVDLGDDPMYQRLDEEDADDTDSDSNGADE